MSEKNQKVLLVDSKFNNYNIYKILNKNIENNIIKIEKFFLIKRYSKIYFNKFNIIIFENPSINFLKTKDILKDCINIYLAEANLIGIKKLNLLINKMTKDINFKEAKIIFNKYNSNSIDIEILSKLFKKIKVGKIEYSDKLDILINTGKLININKIKADLLKITKELIKED